MSFGPIQMLDVLVDPTVDALLNDDGVDGQGPPVGPTDGVEDPHHPGTYVRRGGSGISRSRNPRNPPTAVNDFAGCAAGDPSIDIIPIVNDAYLGVPTITLGAPSDLLGGSLVTTGSGLTFTVTYTPPATGDGGTVLIPYTLRSVGNKGSSRANIRITVDPFNPSPPPPPLDLILTVTGTVSIGGVLNPAFLDPAQPFGPIVYPGDRPGYASGTWQLIEDASVQHLIGDPIPPFTQHSIVTSGSLDGSGVIVGLPASFTADGPTSHGSGGDYQITIHFRLHITVP